MKHIVYEKLQMKEYLKSGNMQLSVQERQYLFQFRMQDIDIRANRPWKYDDIFCISCKDQSEDETGIHILACKELCDRNNIISYLPSHNDLYSTDIEDQIYVSRIIRQNMHIREDLRKIRLVPM